jgi:hypothetical protein
MDQRQETEYDQVDPSLDTQPLRMKLKWEFYEFASGVRVCSDIMACRIGLPSKKPFKKKVGFLKSKLVSAN